MTEVDIPSNFKTTLPPRKRAKTKEEKEQRRIERILRNRKAAHASREKKRKHVEFLEGYVIDLEKQMSLVQLLNNALLKSYKGGNSEIDGLMEQISTLPDLKQMRLEHVSELDMVGMEDSQEQQHIPKTPESYAASPKHEDDDDVPMLENSRQDSMSESDSSSPAFLSPEPTALSKNRFSLDIISGEPELSLDSTVSNYNDSIFVKKEVDDFFPQLAEFNTFGEKLGLDDYRVNTNDNEFDLVELRNPAVIAIEVCVAEAKRIVLYVLVFLKCISEEVYVENTAFYEDLLMDLATCCNRLLNLCPMRQQVHST
jgi:transcriptional activator HAC1